MEDWKGRKNVGVYICYQSELWGLLYCCSWCSVAPDMQASRQKLAISCNSAPAHPPSRSSSTPWLIIWPPWGRSQLSSRHLLHWCWHPGRASRRTSGSWGLEGEQQITVPRRSSTDCAINLAKVEITCHLKGTDEREKLWWIERMRWDAACYIDYRLGYSNLSHSRREKRDLDAKMKEELTRCGRRVRVSLPLLPIPINKTPISSFLTTTRARIIYRKVLSTPSTWAYAPRPLRYFRY